MELLRKHGEHIRYVYILLEHWGYSEHDLAQAKIDYPLIGIYPDETTDQITSFVMQKEQQLYEIFDNNGLNGLIIVVHKFMDILDVTWEVTTDELVDAWAKVEQGVIPNLTHDMMIVAEVEGA